MIENGDSVIEKVASYLTKFLLINKKISEDQIEVYNYGFELFISSLINLVVILILSIFFKNFKLTIFFIIQYYPLKKNCGGYHCKTYRKCIITFSIIYTLILIINKIYILTINNILIIGWITGFFLILLFAPIEDRKKPLNYSMKKRLKKKSILLYVLYSILNIIIRYYTKCNISVYSIFGVIALNLITVLMIAGIINNSFMECKNRYDKSGNYR